ncbi:MAG: putative rane-associated phosphatase [Actinomycetia bacterium]|nr:putative rane-associated phosphatase [Actinomycetes bacterium]
MSAPDDPPQPARALHRTAYALVAVLFLLAGFAVLTENVVQHTGLTGHDAAVLRFFTEHRSRLIVDIARLVTDLGGTVVLAIAAIVTGWILWRTTRRLVVAIAPALVVVLASAASTVTKQVVGRARPPAHLHLVNVTDAAFPSGHATEGMAVYLAIAILLDAFVVRTRLVRTLVLAGALVLAVAIGLRRLVLGVHWPTDVLAGWTLGAAIAILVSLGAMRTGGSARWAIGPRPPTTRSRVTRPRTRPTNRGARLARRSPRGASCGRATRWAG